jgi:CheY-like chemotaxis protein
LTDDARPSVLVVDDADDLRLLVTSVLTAAGHRVVGVASGVEALAHLRCRPGAVDVVVLDIQMPDVDGWEVLETLRSDVAAFGRPAVLMCSVRNSPVDRGRAAALGADAYLSKPFAVTDLTEVVAQLVPTRRLSRSGTEA